jgi:hypothetical protein
MVGWMSSDYFEVAIGTVIVRADIRALLWILRATGIEKTYGQTDETKVSDSLLGRHVCWMRKFGVVGVGCRRGKNCSDEACNTSRQWRV